MMSNQTDDTESVSHHSVLAIEVCPFTDSGQFTHGTGTSSVEPSSTYAPVPNGASPEWDWQMLAHQQQYLQLQQQYQQQSSQGPQLQPSHRGTVDQLPDRSKASTSGLPTSAPQVGVPWTQPMSQSEPEQYDQDIHYNTDAAIFGVGQRTTSVDDLDLDWSGPSETQLSETQSNSSKRSDYGVVKR
jgi:hypothetical protein